MPAIFHCNRVRNGSVAWRTLRTAKAGQDTSSHGSIPRDRARHRGQGPLRPPSRIQRRYRGRHRACAGARVCRRLCRCPAPIPSPSAPILREDAKGPVEWMLIPPRPRNAFWTICLFILGRDPAVTPDGTGRLDPVHLPNGRPGWRLVTDRYDKPFGFATLRPLVRLGLLGPVHAPEPYLVVSARGHARPGGTS